LGGGLLRSEPKRGEEKPAADKKFSIESITTPGKIAGKGLDRGSLSKVVRGRTAYWGACATLLGREGNFFTRRRKLTSIRGVEKRGRALNRGPRPFPWTLLPTA